MPWNTSAHSHHNGLHLTKWFDGPLYANGRFLAVIEGTTPDGLALSTTAQLLPGLACKVRPRNSLMHMCDLFSCLAYHTNNCEDGVMVTVVFLFDHGKVVVGSLGTVTAGVGVRNDAGVYAFRFSPPHTISGNNNEFARIARSDIPFDGECAQTSLGVPVPITGLLGKRDAAGVVTRVPEVSSHRVLHGDCVFLGSSAFFDFETDCVKPDWHHELRESASAEQILRTRRQELAFPRKSASVAFAHYLP